MMVTNNPAFSQVWPIMEFFGFDNEAQLREWLPIHRSTDLYSLTAPMEEMGFCLARHLQSGSVCLPEHAVTMNDFLEFVELKFNDVWKAKVFGYAEPGEEVLQCGASCTNFGGSVLQMTTKGNPLTGVEGLADLRDVMRFRNNIERRGLYFKENFPQSGYGPKLFGIGC